MDYVAFLVAYHTGMRLTHALRREGLDDAMVVMGLLMAWKTARQTNHNVMSAGNLLRVLIDHFGTSMAIWGKRIGNSSSIPTHTLFIWRRDFLSAVSLTPPRPTVFVTRVPKRSAALISSV